MAIILWELILSPITASLFAMVIIDIILFSSMFQTEMVFDWKFKFWFSSKTSSDEFWLAFELTQDLFLNVPQPTMKSKFVVLSISMTETPPFSL
jgi:hypothetical protein